MLILKINMFFLASYLLNKTCQNSKTTAIIGVLPIFLTLYIFTIVYSASFALTKVSTSFKISGFSVRKSLALSRP